MNELSNQFSCISIFESTHYGIETSYDNINLPDGTELFYEPMSTYH